MTAYVHGRLINFDFLTSEFLLQVGATPDLMVSYIDFFLGGDEKRIDMVASIQRRFPMRIICGGDGSYMCPYNLYTDTLLTNLIAQVTLILSSAISKLIGPQKCKIG